jgi:alpha-beta hydrolase superfamily lysophospholipase
MKMTRRNLAAALVSATAAAAQQPQPAFPAESDLLKAARDRMQANVAALAATPLPMATEPAFQFKA